MYIARVLGVYEQWKDCQMQVNGFSGNNYKGYMSRGMAGEKWRNHLRKKNRMSNFIVITTTLLFVVGCVLYFFT